MVKDPENGIKSGYNCKLHDNRGEFVYVVNSERKSLCPVCAINLSGLYHVALLVRDTGLHKPKEHDGIFVYGQSN